MRLATRWLKRAARLLLTLLAIYALMVLYLALNETGSVYHPFAGPTEPDAAGLPHFTRHTLENGTAPTIVYWENTAPGNAPTVLYFHGNAGGLHAHAPNLARLDAQRLHVVAMEYPGFPGAAGRPTEPLIIEDARALYDHVHAAHPRIILWGYSLGSGVAVQLAAQRPVEAMVLEAPFTAVVDRAGELFPLVPVRLLMKNTYLSRDYIAENHAPLFIMHGDADRIVPIHHGRALFALAHEPKTFHAYAGAGHLDLRDYGAYEDAFAFISAQR